MHFPFHFGDLILNVLLIVAAQFPQFCVRENVNKRVEEINQNKKSDAIAQINNMNRCK